MNETIITEASHVRCGTLMNPLPSTISLGAIYKKVAT